MSRTLLVLRPEPGNGVTVAAARAMGFDAIAAPLFTVSSLDWALPDRCFDGVLMTSANAGRHGGAKLEQLFGLPLYAVGNATGTIARDAGFGRIVVGEGNVDAVLALARRDGMRSLLHLSGRDYREPAAPGLAIERRIVYAADPVEALPDAARAALPDAIALLHSPRAATLFAHLVEPAGIAIAAISASTLEAAGGGWRTTGIADTPSDASLLAVAAKLCDQGR